MKREYDVVIERDADGYYVASVPGLQGCHTQARSLDDLMVRTREAIELCLAVASDEPPPPRIRGSAARCHHWMTKLPRLTGKDVVSALDGAGFTVVRCHFSRG